MTAGIHHTAARKQFIVKKLKVMEDQNGHQVAILEVGNVGGQTKSEEQKRKATASKTPKVSTVSKTISITNVN